MKKRWITMLIVAVSGVMVVSGCSRTPVTGFDSADRLHACPDERHKIAPLTYDGSPENALKRLRTIVLDTGKATIVSERSNYLHAEFRSKWFKFVDDVEFWLPETNDAKGIIHIRSASRSGYSDFGVNRERMEEIRILFDASRESN